MPEVNTATVNGFRNLSFTSLDDVVAEVDRIVATDRAGTLQMLGNWTPAQICAHLAAWIEYGYDGYPIGKPPWPISMILRFMGKRFLKAGLSRGVKIPRVSGGTTGADDGPLDTAAERLRCACRRLQSGEPSPYDSPAFGPMSHEDRIRLNLRHAELHLGFCRY